MASANELEYFKGSHNPIGAVKAIHHDSLFYQQNPDYFHPDGIICFCGPQGSGKSLSAALYVEKMHKAYPKSIVCSNLQLNHIENVCKFEDYEQIKTMDNQEKGIIFLIDEIHVLWNSLESKNIPISEMAIFSQLRHRRLCIVGTTQVYGRIAKPIREQLKYAVRCRSFFKYLQVNQILDPNGEGAKGEKDGDLDAEHIKTEWFFHRPEYYTAYDTYKLIERIDRKKGVKK